jgi:hypothetical protein
MKINTPVAGANHAAPTTPSAPKLTRAQRIFKVRLLVIMGKSNREIARELGYDEGTIRNDRKIIALPEEKFRQAKAGAPVAPLLREHKAEQAARVRKRQEEAEKQDLFLTTRLAKAIGEWLEQFPLLGVDKMRIIRAVDHSSFFHQTQRQIVADLTIKCVIDQTRPSVEQPSDFVILLEWVRAWLYSWITKAEPFRDVRDRALTKVRIALEQECPGW